MADNNRISYVSGKIVTPEIELGLPLNTVILSTSQVYLSTIDVVGGLSLFGLTAAKLIQSNNLFSTFINLGSGISFPANDTGVIINDVSIYGNFTIYGGLTALSGIDTIETQFLNTSAFSVVNNGAGPAVYIEQKGNTQPVLHIKANNNTVMFIKNTGAHPGYIGIKTVDPNVELTVVGDISASGTLFSGKGNSNEWESAYTTVRQNSATWGNQGPQGVQGTQGRWGNQGTQGTQGHQGMQGVQGAQGRQGRQGTQGTQGIQGA